MGVGQRRVAASRQHGRQHLRHRRYRRIASQRRRAVRRTRIATPCTSISSRPDHAAKRRSTAVRHARRSVDAARQRRRDHRASGSERHVQMDVRARHHRADHGTQQRQHSRATRLRARGLGRLGKRALVAAGVSVASARRWRDGDFVGARVGRRRHAGVVAAALFDRARSGSRHADALRNAGDARHHQVLTERFARAHGELDSGADGSRPHLVRAVAGALRLPGAVRRARAGAASPSAAARVAESPARGADAHGRSRASARRCRRSDRVDRGGRCLTGGDESPPNARATRRTGRHDAHRGRTPSICICGA